MNTFNIISIFPDFFTSPFSYGIVKRAIDNSIIKVNTHNLRDYSKTKIKSVDDTPFGGGPGMILSPEPLCSAIRKVNKKNTYTIFLSPQGKKLDQKLVNTLKEKKDITLICGRYEGIDQRVIDEHVDLEVSVGDYILSGGESAACILVESIARLLKGALGNEESLKNESFNEKTGYLSFPQYTKPREYEGRKVPEVLLSGNHSKIDAWRKKQAILKTKKHRPDLIKNFNFHICVVHYPIYNKTKEIISTSYTNLDLHDFARLSRTYDIKSTYFVSNLDIQKKLGSRIVDYWTKGLGAKKNPDRCEALKTIKFRNNFEEIKKELEKKYKNELLILATTAKSWKNSIKIEKIADFICKDDKTILLVFGTGHGLTDEFIDNCDYVLEPIKISENYNHLSVRSAASIIIDRIYRQ